MRRYIITFVGLIVLTALTLGLSRVHLGEWSIIIALSIATAKAVLVAWVFMHLIEQGIPARVTALVAVVLIIVFITLTALDVSSRTS